MIEYPGTGMTHCPWCLTEFHGEVKPDGTIGFRCTPFRCGNKPYKDHGGGKLPGVLPHGGDNNV